MTAARGSVHKHLSTGMAPAAVRWPLSGRGDELVDLAKTNVARRLFS